MTARAAYRRVKKVIALQWRGVVIVLIIIIDVIFFTVIFIQMDNATESERKHLTKFQPWLTCLIFSGGDKNSCLDKASALVEKESSVMAVLYLLSVRILRSRGSSHADHASIVERLLVLTISWPVADGVCLV